MSQDPVFARFRLSVSPVSDVHSHGAWLPQAAVDQDGAVRPVQLGHLDGVPPLVTPVEVPSDPVHRQAVRVAERRAMEDLEATVKLCGIFLRLLCNSG